MDKYKVQIIVIVLTLLIGMSLGHLYTKSVKNKEIEKLMIQHKLDIQNEIKQEKNNINLLNNTLLILRKKNSVDSLDLLRLRKKENIVTTEHEHKLDSLNNLDENATRDWVVGRYPIPVQHM